MDLICMAIMFVSGEKAIFHIEHIVFMVLTYKKK